MKFKNILGALMLLVGLRAFETGVMPKFSLEFLIFFAIFALGLYFLITGEMAFHKNRKKNRK